MVIHRSEEPEYSRSYAMDQPITAKVYVIYSGDYCTTLFVDEYKIKEKEGVGIPQSLSFFAERLLRSGWQGILGRYFGELV